MSSRLPAGVAVCLLASRAVGVHGRPGREREFRARPEQRDGSVAVFGADGVAAAATDAARVASIA